MIILPTVRKSFKIILLFLALVLPLSLFAPAVCGDGAAKEDTAVTNILLLTLDETGYNTDSVILVGISGASLRIMQIPRDTYYNDEGKVIRVNQIYYRAYGKLHDEKNAIGETVAKLSDALGVKIRAGILLSPDVIRLAIDTVNGVTLTLPDGVALSDGNRDYTGENRLNGSDFVALARHRKSYLTGDIGRIHAQKYLIAALCRRMSEMNLGDYLRLAFALTGKVRHTVRPSEMAAVLQLVLPSDTEKSFTLLSLPGEAAEISGVWYYIPSKIASARAIIDRFGGNNGFDPKRVFCPNNEKAAEIYENGDETYSAYSYNGKDIFDFS